MENLYVSYKDKVQFFLIYISEAHPNLLKAVGRQRPKNIKERAILATKCVSELKLSLPLLLDTMDGVAEKVYKARPDRICVVDVDGKVAYYSGRGPWGFKPKDAEAVIKKLLAHDGRLPSTASNVSQ